MTQLVEFVTHEGKPTKSVNFLGIVLVLVGLTGAGGGMGGVENGCIDVDG